MSLIGLLVFVIIVGLLFWLVTMLPLPAPFALIARVLLILICIVWLASQFGVFGSAPLRIR